MCLSSLCWALYQASLTGSALIMLPCDGCHRYSHFTIRKLRSRKVKLLPVIGPEQRQGGSRVSVLTHCALLPLDGIMIVRAIRPPHIWIRPFCSHSFASFLLLSSQRPVIMISTPGLHFGKQLMRRRSQPSSIQSKGGIPSWVSWLQIQSLSLPPAPASP